MSVSCSGGSPNRPVRRTAATRVWIVLLAAVAGADAVSPPLVGQPDGFSGAIGSGFHIQMQAEPLQLQAEDPLILTVTITGPGSLRDLRRPNLLRLPRFAEQFHIDNLPERDRMTEKTHTFVYRLRPRTDVVKEIPPLPFVYFNPKIVPPEKGYQKTFADAIPLTVRPRALVKARQVEGAVPMRGTPDSVYQLVEGRTVLRQDPIFALPGIISLAGLFLGPPLVAGLWYLVWRRRYPSAAHLARKRRSRAAQQALKTLHRLEKRDTRTQAQEAEAILAGYLRQRLELQTAEPTPAEVAQHLQQVGAPLPFTQEMASFFADCNAARYAPGLMDKTDHWAARATCLVLAAEEKSWPLCLL
jgi:hypothetical protein